MVRYETVEVTKQIMKSRKSQRISSQNKKAVVTPESGPSSPTGSSSPFSSSSSSYSSELSGGEDVSSQPSPRGSDSPVYCVMSTIPHMEEEPGEPTQEDCDGSETSGAVKALTEVARGLGMDVVWFPHAASNTGSLVTTMHLNLVSWGSLTIFSQMNSPVVQTTLSLSQQRSVITVQLTRQYMKQRLVTERYKVPHILSSVFCHVHFFSPHKGFQKTLFFKLYPSCYRF